MYGALALPQSMRRLRTWRDQVGKLDDNFALPETILIERPPIRDNEILGLDIAMEDKSIVAGGDSLTHLGEHGSDQTETGRRE